jgi:serine protease
MTHASSVQLGADKELFVGGAFEFRKPGLATSRVVPPAEIDPLPLSGEFQYDKRGVSNQLIVRLDPRSSGLNEALLRSVDARAIDSKASKERAFVDAVRQGIDPLLNAALGGAISARAVIATQRDGDEVRNTNDDASPRELLQQMIVLRYPEVAAAENAINSLKALRWFEHVQLDQVISPSSTPTDPLYVKPAGVTNAAVYQWGLHAMNFAGAWQRTTGHAYVGIADAPIWPYNAGNLLDFGTTSNPTIINADLRANFRQQFVTLSGSITNTSWNTIWGHGQHVVGIVAAGASTTRSPASSIGVAGGCPNCSVVFSGRRGNVTTSSGHASSVYLLTDGGAQVINVSANSTTPNLACSSSDVSAVAIAYATGRDVLYVVSSGNDNFSFAAQYPANCPNAFVVGGIESTNPEMPSSAWSRMDVTSTFKSSVVTANGVLGVVAPARRIVSTFHDSNISHNSTFKCGSSVAADEGQTGDSFGTCTGTSMAAPHVSALSGLLRSASPLTSQSAIQSHIRNASTVPANLQIPSSPWWSDVYGYGLPSASIALASLIPTSNPQNRLTPLFSMYSAAREDYFYTTVPQMGAAALLGSLPPRGNNVSHTYSSVGITPNGYASFPGMPWWQTTGAEVWIFSTPENPKSATTPLSPLFRLSFACNNPQYSNTNATSICANNPSHTDTTYTTDQAGINAFVGVGYRLDGIEGFIYPKTLPQPPGSVRLMRKYNATRDDHAIFPETLLTQYTNQGYTLNTGSDWLGYVYPNANGNVPTIQ